MANNKSGGLGILAEMWQEIQLAWRLFRDDQVPVYLKVIPVLGLVYVVSPVDLILDVVPVLGQMDDIAVIAFTIKTFVDLAPKDRVAYHRALMDGTPPPGGDDERTIDGRYKS
jgi:uncharacterized membrane protein YkvA (DUF1232 family)